ncbi:MAG TPA: ATP-binding protein [Thermoanaerobaculia bacterium]|nr:ATP-binding protein [Thermoanaerobaculia bacterium]
MEIAATKAATSLAASIGMSPDRIDEVRMAVVEACINAFEHSGAPDSKVYIDLEVRGTAGKPEELTITIRDRGIGFDPGTLPNPSIEQKLKAKRKRGWGLKIIEGLMDAVEIHSGAEGTTVKMSKRR